MPTAIVSNKNKARLKFVLRERGFDWLKETIEREYADILTNGGIPMPDEVPEGFGGFQTNPPALGTGADLPVIRSRTLGSGVRRVARDERSGAEAPGLRDRHGSRSGRAI